MKRSPEIEAVVRRLWEAALARDLPALDNLISREPAVRAIALADDEWWVGHDLVAGLWGVRVAEAGFTRVEYERLEAFEEGPVGWAAGAATFLWPSGDTLAARFTAVLRLEAGMWRIVQWHGSKGVPNEDTFGYKLTHDLAELVSSLGAEAARDVATASDSGTVTLMFTDIEDSTRLTAELGDAAWASAIETHFAAVRPIVERHGGTLVKTMGDGAMMAFPSATGAVYAAVEIQRAVAASPLRVRIGIHTGDATLSTGDYLGISVNKAARVASAASGGEILLSSITAELWAGPDASRGEARNVELKGLDGTHRVVPVLWSPADPSS